MVEEQIKRRLYFARVGRGENFGHVNKSNEKLLNRVIFDCTTYEKYFDEYCHYTSTHVKIEDLQLLVMILSEL